MDKFDQHVCSLQTWNRKHFNGAKQKSANSAPALSFLRRQLQGIRGSREGEGVEKGEGKWKEEEGKEEGGKEMGKEESTAGTTSGSSLEEGRRGGEEERRRVGAQARRKQVS